VFDCDNHSYETRDAFTRHLPKEYLSRTISAVTLPDGSEAVLAGDRIVTSMELDRADLAYRPGSLKEMLKQMASGNPEEAYHKEPMRPEYQEHDARVVLMDRQGLAGAVIYPGGWALMAEQYVRQTDALYANLHSFNIWTEETWGFGADGRIYAPALLSLRDLPSAVAELDYVLGRGARFILLPTGPVYGRSPGDPYFDPFWCRINEAGATVAYHITEAHYNAEVAPAWGHDPQPAHFRMSAWQWQHTYGERPIMETLSALIFDNLFGRYPNIYVLASEFGATWIPHYLIHMDKSRGMGRNGPWIGGPLKERPSEIFHRHVRVVPYPEDDVVELVRQLKGRVDCLVAGSDFPHAEGLAEPLEFRHLLNGLPEEDITRILDHNAQVLL
jgi:predicted TIM-barrel fold metal-dependent hydrolase